MLIEQAVAEALESIFDTERSTALEEQSDTCIWLGLSGGVDSTVLLHGAAHYCSTTPGSKLKAIHIHHGLSNNADAWAKQAQSLCEQLSAKFSITIDCIIEKVQLDDCMGGVEQAARTARYQVFEKHCGPNDVLLQGHHLDDQIETFFMRAIRGSGLTGLASIPKQRSLSRKNSCQIVRPLLSIEKSQLISYAQQNQLSWVEDESNQDSKFERNWWRNELLPQIWQRYPKQKPSLSRTINNIQHEQDLLQQLLTEKLMIVSTSQQACSSNHPLIHPALSSIPRFDLSKMEALDQATSLSYLRAWLAQFVDILPSAIQMQTIYVDMFNVRQDAEPCFQWAESSLRYYKQGLYLLKADDYQAEDSKSESCKLEDSERNSCELNHCWQGEVLQCISGRLNSQRFKHAMALRPAEYRIRYWQGGDVAKPFGRSTRKMKKWWQDYSVPSWMRHSWPIVVDKETNEIAAVPGLFVCQNYCVEQGQTGWQLAYKVTKE